MGLAIRFCRVFQLATSLGLLTGAPSALASSDRQAIERRIRMVGGEQCPTQAAVAAETWELTPPDRRAVLEELREVLIEDLGASYRIVVTTVKGRNERVYPGAEQDCEKRARFVAVFVVLTLMPPEGPEASAPAVDPPSTAVPATPLPPGTKFRARPFLRLELAAILEEGMPVDRATGILCVGGDLRALLATGVVVPSLGLSYAPAAHFDTGSAEGELARATVAAGLRARLRWASWELGIGAGAVAVVSHVAATSLAHPASDSGVEMGIETTLVLAVATKTPLHPFVGTKLQWIPSPHRFSALPRNDLGGLPPLWIGASAGIALNL